MQIGGVILCGGQSSRMGWSKALLPFGPELMLQRVVRLLREVVSPLVVVAATDQQLPELPPGTQIVRDRDSGRGPLEGLRAGFSALAGQADAAYATGCDVPLLSAGFVRRMISELQSGDYDIAVPEAEGYQHPLAAVYRLKVTPYIEQLLAADRLRPVFLFEQVRTRVVPAVDLIEADPRLHTLRNLNHPAEYLAALAAAGFQAPANVLEKLSRHEH